MLDLLPPLVLRLISSAHYEGKQIVIECNPKCLLLTSFLCLGHPKEQQISAAVSYWGCMVATDYRKLLTMLTMFYVNIYCVSHYRNKQITDSSVGRATNWEAKVSKFKSHWRQEYFFYPTDTL